jgi:chemotaxis protein CheX
MSENIATDAHVDPEIRHDLVEPFIAATSAALSEMAGAEPIVVAVRQQSFPDPLNDITAVVEITATTTGYLVLSFPQPTAAALTAQILAGATRELDENLIRDCAGEMANVIAGQAKAMLAGGRYQFTFSIPKVLASASDFRPPQRLDCLIISFRSEQGEFTLQLLLSGVRSCPS